MSLFEVRAPDGRALRVEAPSRDKVIAGYEVLGEVVGADAANKGGYLLPFHGKSLMATLLEYHGEELKDWLRANLPTFDVPAKTPSDLTVAPLTANEMMRIEMPRSGFKFHPDSGEKL